ncbi:alpha/beta fold hydrolase [Bifidobacterium pullorum subsp. saeculare]|uniref:Alpha/beta fold hydrolase n=1 Tax=Bifidobacterium pullorum subsp. saeculare TaxID=78257 RepID=A0A938WWF2_9BIFI|nr:alpha/beta fold hydrolase [Bifidobacterium pullorum]MBM6698850.1 alpha/beta fold hydrolase [Bifidobacterium pullorum subsp. saeculare]
MGWQVRASVQGGRRLAPADLEEYRAAATALDDAGDRLRARSETWTTTMIRLRAQRADVPLCPAISGHASPAGHEMLPYDALGSECERHAASCERVGEELKAMAALLVRAHQLYEEAESNARRTVTELVQAGVQLKPSYAAAGTAALAAGGLVVGSIKEGRLNPIHALDATAWAQEGLMSGAGALVGGVAPGKGVARTDEVNTAAGRIATVSAPVHGAIQGSALTVREVTARTDVVRASSSVAESLENLRRLAEERLGKIDLDSGLSYATIAVQRYRQPDGSSSWLVTIPGTDGKANSPFGWPQNVELMSSDAERRRQADSARMVVEAMEMAGIPDDEPVALIGHSQGGIVAAAVAADQADRFDIRHVVTAGSPVANHPIPDKTWVTSIEIDDELVAALDGAQNPVTDTWLTVRGTTSPAPAEAAGPSDATPYGAAPTPYDAAPVADSLEGKEITHWLKYHQAAYRNATDLGSPAVAAHEEHFAGIVTGDLAETRYFEGRMQQGADLAPAKTDPPRPLVPG